MWKFSKKPGKKLGKAVLFIGIGMILTIIIPRWAWIAVVGIGLIVWGWRIIK